MMIKRACLLVLLGIFCFSEGYACSCPEINEYSLDSFIKHSDYVVLGRVIYTLSRPKYEQSAYENNGSSNAMLIVERSYKGNLQQGDTLLVMQMYNSMCIQLLEKGKSYLVSGQSLRQYSDELIEEWYLPSPPPAILYKEDKEYKQDSIAWQKTTDHYKSLICQYPTAESDGCRVFRKEKAVNIWGDELKKLDKE